MTLQLTVNAKPSEPSAPSSELQWLRKVGLIVSSGSSGLDLSSFRIRFRVQQWDVTSAPNHTIIRVYNLSDDTAKSVQKEFQRVTLQAGYEGGSFGVIFDGTLKMARRGRESPTDTYLDILAADADVGRNFSVVNKTLAAGATPKDQMNAVIAAMGLPTGYVPDLPAGALSRGKVLFGMARSRMTDIASSSGTTWSVQNGQVVVIPLTGYRPDQAVVLNSNTGMIDKPEQTEDGIHVKTLINPRVKIGTLVQINNASIQRAFLGGDNLFFQGRLETLPGLLPKVTDDGFYRVYVAEHYGDTRGTDWYSDLTCLAIDASAAPAQSVKAG